MKYFMPVLLASILLLTACGAPATALPTYTIEPTVVPSNTSQPTMTPTRTLPPTWTPSPTFTPLPTLTPTNTLEPRSATQTAQVVQRHATQAYNQRIKDLKASCMAIDWKELSTTQYAKDHEGELVYIMGRIYNVDLDEGILAVWIGNYSANIAVGTNLLNNNTGRIVEDMWIKIYGRVCTTCWISTNRLDGEVTHLAGINALLVEGANVVWVAD